MHPVPDSIKLHLVNVVCFWASCLCSAISVHTLHAVACHMLQTLEHTRLHAYALAHSVLDALTASIIGQSCF